MNDKPKLTPKEAAERVVTFIKSMLEEAGVDIEMPRFFIVGSDTMGELLISARKVIRERSLSRGVHKQFHDVMVNLIKDMSSVSHGEADVIAEGLHIVEDRGKWKEALDKFFGTTEPTDKQE